jgi:hypothetical protein
MILKSAENRRNGNFFNFIQIIIVIFSALNKHFINNAQDEKQNIKNYFFIFINKRKHYFGFCMGPMGAQTHQPRGGLYITPRNAKILLQSH